MYKLNLNMFGGEASYHKKEGMFMKIAGIIVLVLAVAVVGIGVYTGVFRTVRIEKAMCGPYKIVCLDHIGPYKNICQKIKGVEELLSEKKIVPVAPCGVYYDNPKEVASDKLRSKGGCIVEGDVKIDIAEKMDIPKREVVVAKIKAHPCVSAMKTYPRIAKYLIANKYVPCGPCLEIYHKDGTVETQMPIALEKEAIHNETAH